MTEYAVTVEEIESTMDVDRLAAALDKLDAAVVSLVRYRIGEIFTDSEIRYRLKRQLRAMLNSNGDRIGGIDSRLASLESERRRVTTAFVKGFITEADAERETRRIRAEQDAALAERAALAENHVDIDALVDAALERFSALENHITRCDQAALRETVFSLVHRIEITQAHTATAQVYALPNLGNSSCRRRESLHFPKSMLLYRSHSLGEDFVKVNV